LPKARAKWRVSRPSGTTRRATGNGTLARNKRPILTTATTTITTISLPYFTYFVNSLIINSFKSKSYFNCHHYCWLYQCISIKTKTNSKHKERIQFKKTIHKA
jgi:hypothetical protein